MRLKADCSKAQNTQEHRDWQYPPLHKNITDIRKKGEIQSAAAVFEPRNNISKDKRQKRSGPGKFLRASFKTVLDVVALHSTPDSERPRASKLLNAEFLQQLDNRLQLGVIARRFQRQVGKAHVLSLIHI